MAPTLKLTDTERVCLSDFQEQNVDSLRSMEDSMNNSSKVKSLYNTSREPGAVRVARRVREEAVTSNLAVDFYTTSYILLRKM